MDKYVETDKGSRPDKITVKDTVGFIINQKLSQDEEDNQNRFIAFPPNKEQPALTRKLKKLGPTAQEQRVWESLWEFSEAQGGRKVWIEYSWARLAKAADCTVFDVRQTLKQFELHGLLILQ